MGPITRLKVETFFIGSFYPGPDGRWTLLLYFLRSGWFSVVAGPNPSIFVFRCQKRWTFWEVKVNCWEKETGRPNFDRIILSQLVESTFVFCWAKLFGWSFNKSPNTIKVHKRSTFPLFYFFPFLSDFSTNCQIAVWIDLLCKTCFDSP